MTAGNHEDDKTRSYVAFSQGAMVSHYRIIERLGAGGMGEVYLAVDSKLDRKIALKFLPQQISSQPDAKARFLQEARAASALNHPNICTIHDLQEANGQMFIVMEYVEGRTLRDQTQPFTLKQVVEIGIQVAEGLAAAHEQGIVHRDIKTENIMIRKDGIVQIMDFGLAKLRGASRLTKEGSTVGTVGYMSPEQVQGLDTDHRTDLFSLGVVLYELIAGQLPFKGTHETAIMYEIVHIDPQPLSAIRNDVEPELDRLILDCLQKDPNERCQSAREISRDLRRFKIDSGRKRQSGVSTVRPSFPSSAIPVASGATTVAGRGLGRLTWFAIGVPAAAIVTALAFLLLWRGNTGPRHTLRFTIPAPPGMSLSGPGGGKMALSPDGQRLVFVAADSGATTYLWLRSLNSLTANRLSGTEGASYPFWAPGNQQIGFFAGGKLKKIDVTEGSLLTLCEAPEGRGGTWNRDGTIIFAPYYHGGLSRVSASGGVSVIITRIDSLQNMVTHRWPSFLPDGNKFLYFVRTGGGPYTDSTGSIWVGSLDGSVDRELMRGIANTAYARDHLFFLRERTLMAQRFNVGKAMLSGDPSPVAEGILFVADYSNAVFSVAENGTLVYQAAGGDAGNRLIWFDRHGHILDTVGDPAWYRDCRLSPDGQYLAVDLTTDVSSSGSDVWVYDLNRDVKTRLTFAPGADDYPVWSPDASHIYFSSVRGTSKRDLYGKPSSGAGEEKLLLTSDRDKYPMDCAPDGSRLVFLSVETKGSSDLWVVALAEGGAKAASDPVPFQQTEFSEGDARFSPDGRWLAYYWSNETGRGQVYVRPFPGPGGKWQVSTESGDYPCWRRDGKELFYITEKNMLMAVDVNGTGSSFEAGRPRPLFQMMNPIPTSATSPYDVTADGQRFVIITGDAGQTSTINVVVNWDADLKSK